ncbi:MAG TPA: type IV pilus secretin PilQ [Thermoanaerobaculia bacterium]|nr:type IV pilus secretin PilQ [Thermoanaerobaculia bacterium]
MRRTLRAAATAIATIAVLAGASGCSAVRKTNSASAGPTNSSPAVAPSSPAAEPAASGQVTQAAFNEDADGARVVISADAPLLYTSYEPRPDLLVVEMPGVRTADGFTEPQAAGSLVQSVRVETLDELGKQVTRLSVEHRPGLKYELRSVGRGLAVAFETPREASAETAPVPAPPPVVTEPIAPPALVRAELAHALEEVTAETSPDGVSVNLLADGNIQARDFVLANPPRVVIDLPGVKNAVRRKVLPVRGGLVSRVRVSQFQSAPDPITRIVLDLVRPTAYSVRVDGERLSVVVGSGEPASPAAAPPPVVVAEAEPVVVAEAAPPNPPVEKPAEAPPSPSRTEIVAPPPEPAAAEAAAPAPAPSVTEPPPQPASLPSEPAVQQTQPAALPPGVRQAHRSRARPSTEQPATKEDALFEAAAAVLAQQEQAAQATEMTAFQSRTLAEGQTQFTGEPISLDLKDADIKDVFRTISQLTGLNIVIDPEVRGTVTVQLENVPWDQALDLILKQNSLGYVLENNIMRIATTQKLQAEEGDRARLAEARQAAEPTRTVIKKLSYARAAEITPTLKSIMSRRGDIVVDTRTNTLIIREIPTFLPAVLQLIDNLDTATPQVMIESRIVETTKTLGRSLGINWGFNGVADVAHGNTTNLVFPNNIDGGFRVGLENGPVVGSIRLGNILDTFNLDLSLTAAENQGLLKIISSPKLAALTNTAAIIQSGVQIPVQTTVNNTTTVIYVDATLRLEVTPQITAEGTILLNVVVSKREPAVALNLALGNNVPLTIREYRGQVLVRDGGTTVIGGIFQINDQDQNNMIPGLWKIPILGNLFRNKTRTEKHDELLIFITPRILR